MTEGTGFGKWFLRTGTADMPYLFYAQPHAVEVCRRGGGWGVEQGKRFPLLDGYEQNNHSDAGGKVRSDDGGCFGQDTGTAL